MNFGEAIRTCFVKYGRFKGRASRSEYWYFVLFSLLVGLAVNVLDTLSFGMLSAYRPFQAISNLALFLPASAVTARRLHDVDQTALWVIPMMISWIWSLSDQPDFSKLGRVGVIAIMVLLFGALVYCIELTIPLTFKGTKGPNRFGPDPITGDTAPSPTPAAV